MSLETQKNFEKVMRMLGEWDEEHLEVLDSWEDFSNVCISHLKHYQGIIMKLVNFISADKLAIRKIQLQWLMRADGAEWYLMCDKTIVGSLVVIPNIEDGIWECAGSSVTHLWDKDAEIEGETAGIGKLLIEQEVKKFFSGCFEGCPIVIDDMHLVSKLNQPVTDGC
jgi:hypothetical protein